MLLAIDTATRLISLALHDGQAVVAESTWVSDNYHTTELAPQVALLLRRAKQEVGGLSGLAVAIGPGSYTGLRIGLGFAKGLALAQAGRLPLVGVPTLDGLMRAQPPHPGLALALVQAGRGRVMAVAYAWHDKRRRWESAGEARSLTWAELAAELTAGVAGPGQPTLPPDATYIVGEIDAAGLEQLRPLKSAVVLAGPARSMRRAGFLAEIGWERLRAGADDASRLAPRYGGAPAGLIEDPPPAPPPAVASVPVPEPPLAETPPAAPEADEP